VPDEPPHAVSDRASATPAPAMAIVRLWENLMVMLFL
jgi:hypothetical protein